MHITYKIALRIILLICMLIAFNFIYQKWFFKKDIQKYSETIDLVKAVPDSTTVLYIGESSNNTFREDDIDKRSISSLINDYYPNILVSDITKPATHSGIYKVLLENLNESTKIKTLVVTMNLRSFNAQWIYSKLETPLQKSVVLLKEYPPLINRFLLSFKGYDIKNEKERNIQLKKQWLKDEFKFPYPFQFKNVIEWDEWMANKGITDSTGKKDQKSTDLACHYIKAYGFQIDTNSNPRIKDFNEIINLAKNKGWNVIFNILPENTQKTETLVGKDLVYLMEENTKLLTDYYTRKGVIVVNNLNLVEDKQFIDQDWTTEHYAEKGRKQIAKNIALALKKWHNKDFKNVIYKAPTNSSFFNDCDNGIIWGNMNTITDEKSFSGANSSKTGRGNDFSITFSYPIDLIPNKTKDTINIEFMMYQEDILHNAKLSVDIKGKNIDNTLTYYPLKDKIKATNKWEKYNIQLSNIKNLKEASTIKIYIFNPSQSMIFIDDFKIDFY